MFKLKTLVTAGAAAVLLSSPALYAKVSPAEANKLKGELTPFGATKAGEGEIPAWDGGIKEPIAGYKGSGDFHPDPYAGETAKFTITSANLGQYKDKLSPGQVKMFETYPDTYKMNVYPTHRSFAAPQWVYDNTFKNATDAELISDGNGLKGAYGGIPFPIPQSGVEAVWNHTMRWRAEFGQREVSSVAVQRNGAYALTTLDQSADFIYYHQGGNEADLDNKLFYFMSITKAPARLAGGAILVHETMDQLKEPRQAWAYSTGQRRVRRAPNIAYDTPTSDSDGLRTADETDMFNGSPDRYRWELKGKKVMYVGANNYKLDDSSVKYKDLLTSGHLNPEFVRYEARRVWVVEGNLKTDENKRHIYNKRVLFLDEDTWSVVVTDKYDNRGELWRVAMSHPKNHYEVPTEISALDVYYDLKSKRYNALGLDNEQSHLMKFSSEYPDKSHFTPGNLRRLGKR